MASYCNTDMIEIEVTAPMCYVGLHSRFYQLQQQRWNCRSRQNTIGIIVIVMYGYVKEVLVKNSAATIDYLSTVD